MRLHSCRLLLQIVAVLLSLAVASSSSLLAQDVTPKSPTPDGKAPNGARSDFLFPGGSPIDFLKALQTQYGVDLMSVAEIAPGMDRVHVPKLRLQPPTDPNQSGGLDNSARLKNMTSLYNRLAEGDPRLGVLLVRLGEDPTKATAVTLRPNPAASAAQVQVKTRAFSLRGLPEKNWPTLVEEIERSQRELESRQEVMRADLGLTREIFLPGSVSIHKNSNLLIAMGQDSYLEFVGSVLEAMRANEPRGEAKGFYSVLGQVNRPGRFPMGERGPVNLLEALAESGGTTPRANLAKVIVQRTVDGEVKSFRLDVRPAEAEKNGKPFALQADDIITVTEQTF